MLAIWWTDLVNILDITYVIISLEDSIIQPPQPTEWFKLTFQHASISHILCYRTINSLLHNT